jgi:hypothetical protein
MQDSRPWGLSQRARRVAAPGCSGSGEESSSLTQPYRAQRVNTTRADPTRRPWNPPFFAAGQADGLRSLTWPVPAPPSTGCHRRCLRCAAQPDHRWTANRKSTHHQRATPRRKRQQRHVTASGHHAQSAGVACPSAFAVPPVPPWAAAVVAGSALAVDQLHGRGRCWRGLIRSRGWRAGRSGQRAYRECCCGKCHGNFSHRNTLPLIGRYGNCGLTVGISPQPFSLHHRA